MAKIGLFYGSNTGFTKDVAREARILLDEIEPGLVKLFNIAKSVPQDIAQYDYLIFGISTVNIGKLQDDWNVFWPHLDEIDFSGKKVAIFGLGDQYDYSDTYLDAAGMLATKVKECGAKLVGEWSTDGYQFENSLALEGDHFMCLAIDEENEPDLTSGRLEDWVFQVLDEFGLVVDQTVTTT